MMPAFSFLALSYQTHKSQKSECGFSLEFQQGISFFTAAFGLVEGYGIYTFMNELQRRHPEVRRRLPARLFKNTFTLKHFAILWSSCSFYYGFAQYNMSLQARDFNLENKDNSLPEFT
jgi:hypothetical protein